MLAVDDNVIRNCMDDYFMFCSQHAPDTPELNTCMQSHWARLSKQCSKALLDGGVAKRNASINSSSAQKK